MIFVIPISVAIPDAGSQADADAKRDRLVALLNQPMVRTMAQSRGIPLQSLHTESCSFATGYGFLAPVWVFIESPTHEAASVARGAMAELLSNAGVKNVARMNGVSIGTVTVGDAVAWQPPGR